MAARVVRSAGRTRTRVGAVLLCSLALVALSCGSSGSDGQAESAQELNSNAVAVPLSARVLPALSANNDNVVIIGGQERANGEVRFFGDGAVYNMSRGTSNDGPLEARILDLETLRWWAATLPSDVRLPSIIEIAGKKLILAGDEESLLLGVDGRVTRSVPELGTFDVEVATPASRVAFDPSSMQLRLDALDGN